MAQDFTSHFATGTAQARPVDNTYGVLRDFRRVFRAIPGDHHNHPMIGRNAERAISHLFTAEEGSFYQSAWGCPEVVALKNSQRLYRFVSSGFESYSEHQARYGRLNRGWWCFHEELLTFARKEALREIADRGESPESSFTRELRTREVLRHLLAVPSRWNNFDYLVVIELVAGDRVPVVQGPGRPVGGTQHSTFMYGRRIGTVPEEVKGKMSRRFPDAWIQTYLPCPWMVRDRVRGAGGLFPRDVFDTLSHMI